MTLEELDEIIERLKAGAENLPTVTDMVDVDLAIMNLRHLRRRLAYEAGR